MKTPKSHKNTSAIEVNDIMEVLWQHNFPSRKQIEVLQNGNNISKKEVFSIVGKSINQDLSSFHNDLSSAKAAANSDMKSMFSIFEQLYTKQLEISRK